MCLAAVWSKTASCPSGFVYAYDGCYKVSANELNWIDASIAAVQQNATLASIHSETQSRWTREVMRNNGWNVAVWLGLNQIAEQGIWRYVDGSAFDYAPWSSAPAASAHCAAYSPDGSVYGDACAVTGYSLLRWNESAENLPEGEILFVATSSLEKAPCVNTVLVLQCGRRT